MCPVSNKPLMIMELLFPPKKKILKVKHTEISAGSYAALALYKLERIVPFKSIVIFKELVT